MQRKFRRNLVKRELGTSRIKSAWRQMQIERMGLVEWVTKYNKCHPKTKSCRVTCETAYTH